jgi:hypothetical protein
MTDLFGREIVKALSWKQPFAQLMLHGKIETRTWDTAYRGTVLICVSLQPFNDFEMLDISGVSLMISIFEKLGKAFPYDRHAGMAIATGTLMDTRPMRLEDEAKCFVKYSPERFCHFYENIQAIEPFPFKGAQGWKSLSEADLECMKKVLK